MFTQILSTKGLRELCPDFSKIAFVLLLFFVGFAAPQVQGQIIVVIEELDTYTSTQESESFVKEDSREVTPTIKFVEEIQVYPNPFDAELHIKVSEEDHLNYIELINENGLVVWDRNVYSIPGKFIIESLNPGSYYLKLYHSGGVSSESLIYQP